ncbi:2-succinyl-5-enolpyruvyl-6-hydroxy-3-cyclohexene-1-carboxylic-acid synthase [Flagellimonas nanhaiensis]|uniref:2-succinyl-5-enolpyruvyl-6-hydroxy-3-cyclohexene-1-carboxylate synthase n=1 Tax=Flagellimonas nanhaiensis TaxID=2292706 RepID=A0A371JVC9_9FLAO|nr:2-succinyl-5-enolpyruvyl-6-hydroxy-3-cyclohexene-1-carboxylic-acid synthase [Allomuricauda nanhaiensis]RDY61753.1 2-succinyl-5-enolpyruvyl-6-hydroxy-3-cyclohexene-1-carboxylic-acid synthase [Allomuricauda nanhaiensis]
MTYSDIPSAQTLVLYFKSKGVKNIVISPGSRNAPLTISFTKNPFFNCYSIVDERCAAFFALGMSQQLKEPVAVVCTSGSALLNYYPAVAEAFYSNIPLLVISADRPHYRIDIGDGQTIRQKNVLKEHIGYSANLRQDVVHAAGEVKKYGKDLLEFSQEEIQTFNEAELKKAIHVAVNESFPVHINIPFEEPLYGTTDAPIINTPNESEEVGITSNIETWEDLSKIWTNSERKMVLVGVNPPDSISDETLKVLAHDANTLVFTETTSNVHHPDFFPSIDSIIAPIEKSGNKEELFRALQPEVLVTFGGMIVSKKIKAFLREFKPKYHWHIDPKKAYDTFFCLSRHLKADPNDFFLSMDSLEKPQSDYKSKWSKVKSDYETKRETYLKQIPFSDFMVYDQIIRSIPSDYQVHLSNSSTVRYTQLFPMQESLKVFCNRGTSGIDGSVSTAVGASVHHQSPTLLITGDLSFFYDSNGLWSSHIRKDFRIILVNNSGGGIFRILPGNEDTKEFATFFETKHNFAAEHLAKMYGFEYHQANNLEGLKGCLKDFYQESQQPKILEITTPREQNDTILLDYFNFIS